MELSGWIFVIISWGCILSLTVFCFSRVFKKGLDGKNSEKPVGN